MSRNTFMSEKQLYINRQCMVSWLVDGFLSGFAWSLSSKSVIWPGNISITAVSHFHRTTFTSISLPTPTLQAFIQKSYASTLTYANANVLSSLFLSVAIKQTKDSLLLSRVIIREINGKDYLFMSVCTAAWNEEKRWLQAIL